MNKEKCAVLMNFSSNDVEEGISAVVFFKGCNLTCAFCHNKEMVQRKEINWSTTEEIIAKLNTLKSKNLSTQKDEWLVDWLVFSGGEPTLWVDAVKELNSFAKKNNLKTKLFTNGTYNYEPFLQSESFDQVSVDVKVTSSNLKIITNNEYWERHYIINLWNTLNFLSRLNIKYEIRTLFIKPYTNRGSLLVINNKLKELEGTKPYRWVFTNANLEKEIILNPSLLNEVENKYTKEEIKDIISSIEKELVVPIYINY
jgi:pyruvate formate lyase activating enzyme